MRKRVKKDSGDKNLPRKFERWEEEHFALVNAIRTSLFYPMDRNDFENSVGLIVFQEHKDGFLVIGVGRNPATDEDKEHYSEAKRLSSGFMSMSKYEIESSSGKRTDLGLAIIGYGDDRSDSTLAGLNENARTVHEGREEVVAMLNHWE